MSNAIEFIWVLKLKVKDIQIDKNLKNKVELAAIMPQAQDL